MGVGAVVFSKFIVGLGDNLPSGNVKVAHKENLFDRCLHLLCCANNPYNIVINTTITMDTGSSITLPVLLVAVIGHD